MKEERTITQFGRVSVPRLWWSAIFGGTFFAFGIMLILGLFGVAVGSAASGPEGITGGVKTWAGIWSLVTLFVGFFAGGWLAARSAGGGATIRGVSKDDGRIHGLVVWGLGVASLFYFLLNSTTRIASVTGEAARATGLTAMPGFLENVTTTAAVWMLIAAICGLFGALIGGNAGGYTYGEAEAVPPTRRAA